METLPISPTAEYEQRLAARQDETQRLTGLHGALKRGRVLAIGLVIVLGILGEMEALPIRVALLLGPALLLGWLDWRRQRVALAWRRAEQAAHFYRRRLACVTGAWAETGDSGARYLDDRHPCAPDLDLFGSGYLFERLCAARTRLGKNTLAAWLLAPAAPDEVRDRQTAVAELRSRLDLREQLDVLADDVPLHTDFAPLAEWAAAPPLFASLAVRAAVLGCAALLLAALPAYVFLNTTLLPMLAALLLQALLSLALRRRTGAAILVAEERAQGLAPVAALLARLEAERFTSPRLERLRLVLVAGQASKRVANLTRWLRRAPFTYFLFARPQMALWLERWRRSSGREFGVWLAVLGEVEALAALAAYAFEEPDDPFPELASEACFEAEGLGHPLLPRHACVPNDLVLGGDVRLLVVSGSNMSGKSTLLRSVGANVVLAPAGAPVRARRLRLSPLVVGATLRVQDSLLAGRSRFYAEVLRVRQLLDLAKGAPPLLFLLDELFNGTNSSDRRVGAEAVLRRLLDAGAIGLVTTHDLALTDIGERLSPQASNVHFEDRFEDGAMTFDYRMKPGVVRTSNGLALMRAVGIEV